LDKARDAVPVEGLNGASKGLFLAHLQASMRGPILVLTADQIGGEALLGDIRYFARHEKIQCSPGFFPSWELLPYECLSPLREISGERLDILRRLSEGGASLLIAPVEAVMQYVLPRAVLRKTIFTISKGDTLERDVVEACLADCGYERNALVEERGQFSVRGDILDIFVPAADNPARVEFFGDEVESLRFFDIASQISAGHLDKLTVMPVREIALNRELIERGIANMTARADACGVDRFRLQEWADKIRGLGGDFSGIEMLAPYFYSERETLFDYLPDNALIVLDEDETVLARAEKHRDLVLSEYERARERGDPAPAPEDFYVSMERLRAALAAKKRLSLNSLRIADGNDAVRFEVGPIPPVMGRFDDFAAHARKWSEADWRVTVVAPTKGHVSRVHELLDRGETRLDVDQGRISGGFLFPAIGKVFVAEHEIFGRSHKHRYRRKPKSQSFQRGFKDLRPGDYLVHIDYGIGKYVRARELETGVGGGEFLEILYADDEKLYIPMDGLAYIQKYLGASDTPPPLDKLGGVSWKRQKNRIKESIREMAEDLLKLYARREMAEGYRFTSHPVWLQEFADSFEFVETEDQMRAIEEVMKDLEREKPMDRLICGDVGFGKTEVAMRAAFKVVLDKKQVAVIVPTTILAQQHLNTFKERFREYPVSIDMVNRFRTPRQQRETLEKLKNGKLDIIIGTHRLLSHDVRFADLGLIVIDEEQRFGVKHKEKLKQLRTTVDILTLSATPIPRTLHFSLMGIRDLSVIETPPDDRLAIKTYVRKFDEGVVREAIMREMERGGQVYFVHNKVHSIHSMAEMLRKIVPEIKLGIAHGQLPEHRLEEVMRQFIEKDIDLLLCTSIIESGLDIPSANTIIVNRADQFGLSQLYQLRGRVGRYKHQAYAYLLIPGAMVVSEEARKRLSAIEEMTELGAGFQLASRDLEIRGAGNMLGSQQSGHISAVGFDLYCKLIEETVKEMKGEKIDRKIETEVDLQVKGFIPKNYIPDLNQRLEIYRRAYLADELEHLAAIEDELRDRYGDIPEPAEKILRVLEIKILCGRLHISRIVLKDDVVGMAIEPSTPMDSAAIARLVDGNMRLESECRITVRTARRGWRDDLGTAKRYLLKMAGACHAS
jgi:transcription-repair coupling factor (superfamily II helicase)